VTDFAVHFLEKLRYFVSPKTLLCLGLRLKLGLGLADVPFRSNVFSSKCSRSDFVIRNHCRKHFHYDFICFKCREV